MMYEFQPHGCNVSVFCSDDDAAADVDAPHKIPVHCVSFLCTKELEKSIRNENFSISFVVSLSNPMDLGDVMLTF